MHIKQGAANLLKTRAKSKQKYTDKGRNMNLSNYDDLSQTDPINSGYFKVASSTPTFIIIDDQPLEALGLKATLLQTFQDASIFIAPSYSSGEDLIAEKLIDGRIDLILAFIDMKADGYIAPIERLHSKYPFICLAVAAPLSMPIAPTNSSIVLQCLEAGAQGYVSKSSAIDVIQGAVQSVLKGNVYIPSEIMKAPDEVLVAPERSTVHPFSGLVSLSSRQYLQTLVNEAGNMQYSRVSSAKVRAIRPSIDVTNASKATITGYEIGLTGRQVDVLDLILLGLSNKRICRELDLAEGTVKVHVSAVLRALGARTRTEAVVAAGNIGLKSRVTGQ
jgi:DNA-binding NarL/FixJ family response regulator